MLSPLPFFGPVGAVRIGRIDGEFVVNPTHEQNFEESALDLIVVGTKDGLTMIEAGASEVAEESCSTRSSSRTRRSASSARRRRTCAARPARRSGWTWT